jgi:CRISPR-associated protein Cas2
VPQFETLTLVIYDISQDRARTKVSEACLDFGLRRIQYSAFEGPLTRNRREELAFVLADLLRGEGGKVALIPVCQRDVADRIDLDLPPANQPDGPQTDRPLDLVARGEA